MIAAIALHATVPRNRIINPKAPARSRIPPESVSLPVDRVTARRKGD